MSSSKKPKPDHGPLERAIADGRWAEAEREARALLCDDRSHVQGATGLARCAITRSDLDEALRWAERSARFAPNDIALKAFFAALLVAADRPGDVPPLLQAIAERAPTPTASIVLGQALARLGAMDRFVPLVERLLHRFPIGVAPMLADLADHTVRSGIATGWASADLGLRIVGALHPDRVQADSVLRIASGRGPLLVLDGLTVLHHHGQPDPAAGVIRFALPLGLEAEGEPLSITLDGHSLLGAPLHPRRHAAVEGSAVIEDAADGRARLSGWAWCPGDPPQRVTVRVSDCAGRSITLATERPMEDAQAFGIEDGDYAFTLDLTGSGLEPGLVSVTAGPGDVPLAGSPLPWPGSGRLSRQPTPIALPPARRLEQRRSSPIVDIIVPVYRGREETLACLRSVFAAAREDRSLHEIIVIDDASPEPDLVRDLAALAADGRITLLHNARNLGFPATVNRGLALHPDRDVVLLNADTLVAGDWLARLRAAAHGSHDTGTVTPLSNDATILSYPSGSAHPSAPTPAPTPSETARLDRMARAVNAGVRVELPVGVGFCLYIRRDCLEETGCLEERLFGRGYGEENDFCLRARRLGWRHLAAADVFVAHVGSRSFGRQKAILAARNGRLLERLHPGYDALVQDFIAADPLLAPRRRLDLAGWAAADPEPRAPAVLLVTLSGRGGVARFVGERIAALRAEGWRVLRLSPETGEDPDAPPDDDEDGHDEQDKGSAKATPPERRCRIEVTDRPELRDLVFRTQVEFEELVAVLRQAGIAAVEIHHTLGHDPAVFDLADRLGVPYDLTVHDYGLICPRVNLVDGTGRYCGEPDLTACERCTADPDDRADPDLTVSALRRRTRALVAGARRVTVPTQDVAARLARHTAPRLIDVHPWETVEPPRRHPGPPAGQPWPQRPPGARWRVCTIGAIGTQKGYDVLLACARDTVARDLPLEFVVVGFSEEDPPLFETGRIFVTGRFSEEEAVELVRAQHAHIAFLPSISPETWCYALSTAWRAGLEVVAFELGALGERIRHAGGGHLLPPDLDPATINDRLLGILDARTPHGVAIERPIPFGLNVRPSCPMTDEKALVDCFSTFHARGGSSMIGSVASAQATQSNQIKATAQTLTLAPGFYSLMVTAGGGAAAPGELPLPSVQLAAAPNSAAGVTVEMISSVPGNWLAKPGDTIIIKVAGGTTTLILNSYKHIDRTNALLSLQFARIDDAPAANTQSSVAAPVATPIAAALMTAPAAASVAAPAALASAQVAVMPAAAHAPRTEILAHVQRHGDLRFADTNWAGAIGQKLWIEAFSITPVEGLSPEDIEYKGLTAHGWETPWIAGGNMCGSRGLGTPLIGFSIRLRGAAAERFECLYEGAFVSGYRSPAGQNGSPCRSDAIGDPLEGILLRLVEKQGGAFAQPRSF